MLALCFPKSDLASHCSHTRSLAGACSPPSRAFCSVPHPRCPSSTCTSSYLLPTHIPGVCGRSRLPHSSLTGPPSSQGPAMQQRDFGTEICYLLPHEEAVVSGWNLSQDAFIPTCLVLGKCESEWLGAEMRMGYVVACQPTLGTP